VPVLETLAKGPMTPPPTKLFARASLIVAGNQVGLSDEERKLLSKGFEKNLGTQLVTPAKRKQMFGKGTVLSMPESKGESAVPMEVTVTGSGGGGSEQVYFAAIRRTASTSTFSLFLVWNPPQVSGILPAAAHCNVATKVCTIAVDIGGVYTFMYDYGWRDVSPKKSGVKGDKTHFEDTGRTVLARVLNGMLRLQSEMPAWKAWLIWCLAVVGAHMPDWPNEEFHEVPSILRQLEG